VKARNRMLWRDLWHLRGQVIAAALVVACGVAAFVSMRATYESLLRARDDYYQAFRFADVFASLKRAPLSVATRIAEIPGVAQVRTRVVLQVTLDVPRLEEPASGRLVSIPERPRPMLNDLSLRAGRYVEPGRDDEVIASEAFAVANGLKVGDSLGAVINGRWKRLRIVGVALSPEYIYEVGAGTILPDNRRFGVLWMGETALASAYNMEGAFNDVALALAAGASQADVIERVDLLLARYGGLGAYGRDEQLSHRFVSDEIAQNRVTSTFVPGIFLGVAAFLLHIVLSRLTALQRTQIGLLKAFGYSDREVGLHYLKLALVTVLAGLALGGALGMYAGSWLTAVYRDYYRFPRLAFEVSPHVVSLTLLIALAPAGLGALGAVRRAVRLPPAEAMRPESPATFHAGLLERTGLSARLPSSARMIARSIVRRRGKSFLAVLGIGCAVGILVVGRFGLDAMNYMLRVQFQVVQRDDVMVIFTDPESSGIRHELARLPGVLSAEPFRTVPARLRFEHRTKRIELTGLPPDGELRRLVDEKLRPVQLPSSGVLLTRKLSELLRVKPGEAITASVLEGARPVRTLMVAGLVDEPVGIGAYMDLRALNALMREEGSISGAYLKVDSRNAAALYRALKHLPAVSGVAFRDAVLRSFNQILDRSMRTISVVEVLFACVIAFGVVYNGARIALSERGNELASLRVLGFTRREVTWLLLGEQGLLTLLAIPLGFALGIWTAWLLVQRLNTELYRIPLVLDSATFSFSVLVIVIAALLSGMLVARRIARLDLVAVLKTRE
jgi:putative ABC transport system permease protein